MDGVVAALVQFAAWLAAALSTAPAVVAALVGYVLGAWAVNRSASKTVQGTLEAARRNAQAQLEAAGRNAEAQLEVARRNAEAQLKVAQQNADAQLAVAQKTAETQLRLAWEGAEAQRQLAREAAQRAGREARVKPLLEGAGRIGYLLFLYSDAASFGRDEDADAALAEFAVPPPFVSGEWVGAGSPALAEAAGEFVVWWAAVLERLLECRRESLRVYADDVLAQLRKRHAPLMEGLVQAAEGYIDPPDLVRVRTYF